MESERKLPLTYTTWVRGKEINFSPEAIHNVLNLRSRPLPNVSSYHNRKDEKDYRINDILRDLCVEGAQWVFHDDGRPHFLRRTDLKPMARGWYEFVTRSIMPTGNMSEVNLEQAMLIHSIIIGEDIQVDETIAEQIYKFANKTGMRTKLPFPRVIQRLCNEDKVSIPEDTPISVEPHINSKWMERVKKERAGKREAHPSEQQNEAAELPQAPQIQQGFHQTSWLNSTMQWMYKMDHQLNFLCNTNQFMDEDLLYPYQQIELTMTEMKGRGIPLTIENLKINRQRVAKMQRVWQEYQRSIDEAMSRRSREKNKGKARREEEESEEEESEDED
ncbi:hypothetical protein PIB30_045393 [Stylosanthes scabra]|uniref:Putative plant transposon protein domain-containing protein n=1 Tax=Stylosanthes scabra TaxID=79078 RepID=A0ABU6VG54_9FABA|nr:hypothetical protein [Stylosanthes scabra]